MCGGRVGAESNNIMTTKQKFSFLYQNKYSTVEKWLFSFLLHVESQDLWIRFRGLWGR